MVGGNDPEQPVAFLHSGQLAKSKFCEMESHKADISDLTKSANLQHSRFEIYGCCMTANGHSTSCSSASLVEAL
jgi:hypothetical protein